VEPAAETNQEQIRFWNEQGGPRWVRLQQQLDAQISQLGLLAMQRAAVQSGEQVLDVGCGCGQAALELAERVGSQGTVLGVDISAPMLARARERQHEGGLKNLTFLQADAQTYRFEPARFDLLFSRFGVMFFEDPAAAFANLHTAVSPGGRVCFVCWQALDKNEWASVPLATAARHVPLPPPASPDRPGPFAFANPDRVSSLLTKGGFTQVNLEPHDAQLTLGGGTTIDEAVDFALEIGPTSRLLAEVSTDIRSRVSEDLRTALAPYAKENGVRLGGAVWIVTARRP
jgi:SAM-dependent methyltransferase